jgi:tetratricopeptide (TPR) repeat protein
MAERLSYLPSLGLSVLLVSSLNMILKKIFLSNSTSNRFFGVIIFILCTVYGLRTILRNKDWTTSQNLWNVTIATTDKSFRAYNNRANIFIDKKDFISARNDLFKSLEIYKDHYATTYSIGRTFDGENSLDSAINYYTKSIQDKPNFYKSRINRGIDLLIQEKFEEAIKDFDVCSQLKPHEYFPWYNKAVAYFELKKYKQSKIAVEKALEIDVKSKQAQILLGRIFLEEKNHLEAEKVFTALPENAETLFYLGYAKVMAGEKDESVTMLKKSITLYPAVKKTILEADEFKEIWHLIE